MPKVSVTTTVRQEIGLDVRTKAQIRVALTEYLDLQRQIKALTAKQDGIKALVQQKFDDADQIDALMEGTDVDGVKIKLVCGSSRRLDKAKLMKVHGLTAQDIEDCRPEKPSKPYIKISAPGERDE